MKMVASTTIYKLLFFVIGTLTLTACNNTELETTIQQQNDRIAELEAQLDEKVDLIADYRNALTPQQAEIAELQERIEEECQSILQQNERLEIHLYFLQNTDFASYVTVDADYFITNLERQTGERFEFYIYRLDCFLGDECEQTFVGPTYAEIVVVENGMVFDVVRVEADTHIRMHCPTLVFETGHGLLVCNGWGSGTRGIAYFFFDLRDDGFVPVFGDFVNPSFDVTTNRIRTVQQLAGDRPGFSWVISEIVDDTLVPVSSLYNVWYVEHQVLVWRYSHFVDGEWVVIERIETDENIGFGIHPHGDEYQQNHWFGEHWD